MGECTPGHGPAGSAGNLSLGLQGIAHAPEQGNFLPQALPLPASQPGSAVLHAVPAVSHSRASQPLRFWARTSHPQGEKSRCWWSSLKSTLGNCFSALWQ